MLNKKMNSARLKLLSGEMIHEKDVVKFCMSYFGVEPRFSVTNNSTSKMSDAVTFSHIQMMYNIALFHPGEIQDQKLRVIMRWVDEEHHNITYCLTEPVLPPSEKEGYEDSSLHLILSDCGDSKEKVRKISMGYMHMILNDIQKNYDICQFCGFNNEVDGAIRLGFRCRGCGAN